MTRKEKMRMLGHYEGSICVCGKAKHKRHWLCPECRKRFTNTKEGKELDRACTAHTEAGSAYIDMVKKTLVEEHNNNV
jgi:hypothetical protein